MIKSKEEVRILINNISTTTIIPPKTIITNRKKICIEINYKIWKMKIMNRLKCNELISFSSFNNNAPDFRVFPTGVYVNK